MDKLTNLLRDHTNLTNRRGTITLQLSCLNLQSTNPHLTVCGHTLSLDKDLVEHLLLTEKEQIEDELEKISRKVAAINELLETP